ncbi:MAG: hypothetical protein K0R17_2592 [Rariglobus sp.]|nr:hypothetical protein [Rariglobus sp.]
MAKNSLKWLALLGGVALGAASLAVAQDSGPLIDTLVKKGILTDQEGEELRVELLKDFGGSPAGKLGLSSALKEFRISGDGRVRYENRSGQNDLEDNQERARWRYRLRFGLTGKFGDGWFFGTRMETGTGNRSSNATFGDYANTPFGKGGNNAINVGQIYIGRVMGDFTITAGRFANPLTTTSMVWDGDINFEGLAEQWKHESGNVTWMANLSQVIYDDGNPENSFGGAAQNEEIYLLANQIGAKIKFSNGMALTVLPTYYAYANENGELTGGLTTGVAYPTGLSIVEIPVELAFTIGSLPARVWIDYAMNLDADERADFAGASAFDGEDTAYQIGFGIGQTKVKGDWEAKVFWQSVEAFALDGNLVDSDLFDSRTNMEGVVLQFGYVLSDGVTANLTYAHAERIEDALPAYGAGDIGTTALEKYNLIQADLNIKF